MSNEKNKALAAALAQVEKNFGKGSIMKMGGNQREENLDVISTGSLGVDLAFGVGDLSRGHVMEVFGPESSGKTTLYLEATTQCQKSGGICAFIDAEYAFDPVYARRLGVKVEEFYPSQPDTDKQALEICDVLVRPGGVGMVVADSVTALVPKTEIEGEMDDNRADLQARLISQVLRKLTGYTKRTNTLVVFTSQIHMKIDVMFGSPETITGGSALKFYASVQLGIRRTGQIKKGDDVIGDEIEVKVIKNKVAPPFCQAGFGILYGGGVSWEDELIDLGVKYDTVEESGVRYSYNDAKIRQGKDNVRIWLKENPEIADKIDAKIRATVGINTDITRGKLGGTDGERPEE